MRVGRAVRHALLVLALLASAASARAIDLTALSFNVCFDGDRARYQELVAWSLAQRPDLLLFQECTVGFVETLKAADLGGYTLAQVPIADDGYGQVTLSRIAPTATSVIPLPTRMGRKALVTTLPLDGGVVLDVINVHIESIDATGIRQRQLGLIREKEGDRRFLIAGDFNVASGDADNAIFAGLRELAPTDPEAASFDPLRNRLAKRTADPGEAPSRIDRCMTNDESVTGSTTLQRVELSDHYPIIIRIHHP
jgi:endonuclease/exonuclease/phosphatase family metal-dependent hydrolase